MDESEEEEFVVPQAELKSPLDSLLKQFPETVAKKCDNNNNNRHNHSIIQHSLSYHS